MAHQTYLIFHYNTKTENNNIELVAPIHILQPKYIPGYISFFVSIGLMEVDVTQESLLKMVFTNPNGETSSEFESGLIIPEGQPIVLDPEYRGYQVTVIFNNVDIKVNGIYTLTVYLNNILLSTTQIPVIQLGEPR